MPPLIMGPMKVFRFILSRWKQIRMSLVFEYDWQEIAVFTKHKHIILTWENSLKYSAWQLSFALSCISDAILKKYQKRDGTLQWRTGHEIFFAKRYQLQTVTLDILIQFGELVCSIRVSVPRRTKENGV
jgi:hypothetical protein